MSLILPDRIDGRSIIGLPSEKLKELDYLLGQKERLDCERSFSAFVKSGWKYIDPSNYVHNWHLDAIGEHLSAAVHGEIRNLLIMVPPRTSKSSYVSVALAPWVWAQEDTGPLLGPKTSFLYSSYAQSLSMRDSMKSRRLITSPWYQARWGDRFNLAYDQNTKGRFDNDSGGYRIATSVGGALTGEGASIIVADDVHNSVEIESDAVRSGVLTWWDEAMSTRLNDPKTGIFIVVMQRLHENDLAGHIMEKLDDSWTVLMLPMEYDPMRHCSTSVIMPNGEPFEDPRTEEGELLWPERIGEKEVSILKDRLGPFAAAGQLQQSPSPRGGGIVLSSDWKLWDEDYASKLGLQNADGRLQYPVMDFVVTSLDSAYTEDKQNDYSAAVTFGVWQNEYGLPKVMLLDAWEERLELHGKMPDRLEEETDKEYLMRTRKQWGLVEKTLWTCKRFKSDVLLIENKASGKSVAQELYRLFSGNSFGIHLIDPKGDKVARLYSVQHLFSNGTIYAPDRDWAQKLIDRVASFPKVQFNDLCFVAGTLIATKRGNVRIEEVTNNDYVLTPDGWKKVLFSGCTGIKNVITKFGLTGTKYHPIFQLDSSYQCLQNARENKLVRLTCLGLLRTALLKSFFSMKQDLTGWADVADIIFLEHQRKKVGREKDYMLPYGNTSLAEKYRMVMRFIIKIIMFSILIMKTWSVYRVRSIEQCLRKILIKRKLLKGLEQIMIKLLRGIGLTTEENGIGNTRKKLLSQIESVKNIHAYHVVKNLHRLAPEKLNIVPMLVCLGKIIGKRMGILVQEKQYVNAVVKNSIQNYSKEPNIAANGVETIGNLQSQSQSYLVVDQQFVSNVGLNLQRKTDREQNIALQDANSGIKEKVYNLTVEDNNCYFANGILVHNCDAATQGLSWLRNNGLILRANEVGAILDEGASLERNRPHEALYNV